MIQRSIKYRFKVLQDINIGLFQPSDERILLNSLSRQNLVNQVELWEIKFPDRTDYVCEILELIPFREINFVQYLKMISLIP